MSDERKREPKLTVSQDFSVLQPGPQNAYLIAEADWKRIKRIVTEIVPPKNAYQIVSSGFLGVLVSSAFALLTFKLSNSPLPGWAWTVVICAASCSLLMTIAFYYFDSQQEQATNRSVTSVLDEIREIEQNRTPASLPGPSFVDVSGEEQGLTILSAVYGAAQSWKDVASILSARIEDGKLLVPVTNEELGPDPLPNVEKRVEVAYSHGGRTYRKVVAENETLSIPEP
jgi:hypothetical protein